MARSFKAKLAPKAPQKSPISSNTLMRTLPEILAADLALALASSAARRSMHPLYGATVTDVYYFQTIISLALSLAALKSLRPPDKRSASKTRTLLLSGLYFAVAPMWEYWVAVHSGRRGSAVWGAVGTLVAVLGPVQWLFVQYLSSLSVLAFGFTAFANFLLATYIQQLWDQLVVVDPSHVFFAASALAMTLWAIIIFSTPSSTLTRAQSSSRVSQALFVSLLYPALLFLTYNQPPTRVLPLPYTPPLNPEVRILHSAPSLTGQLVIGENRVTNVPGGDGGIGMAFRYMRVDHSLIGGTWLAVSGSRMDDLTPPVFDEIGVELGDPIYSTFVLQEAVRLAERADGKQPENALIIGLGAGIAANALMQHGLRTTILEIDPGVYNTARTYFGLQEPYAVYLQDADAWIKDAAHNGTAKFDMVIHDVFSGGGVPSQLFVEEFWDRLKQITSSHGVIAINFVGILGSDSARSVVTTLQASFPHCRAFHDYLDPPTDRQLKSEFINVVIFCTPASTGLAFRLSNTGDYLSSFLRERMLSSLPHRELDLRRIKGDWPPASSSALSALTEEDRQWILTSTHDPLTKAQQAMALEHWGVMRGVLPDIFWETY